MEKKNTPTEKLVKQYIRYLKLERNYTVNTIEAYQHDLEWLLKYCKENSLNILEIKLEDLENFATTFHEHGMTPKSQARILSGVRSFYRYLLLDGFIEQDPTELLESPQLGKHLPEVLSTEEVDILEASIDLSKPEGQRNKAIIEVLFSCGLRVSELINLKLSQLYLEEEFVRVMGKGNKERIVYLNSACITAIQDYMKVRPVDGVKDKTALFISRNNNRMSVKTIQAMVYKYLEKIGLSAQGYSCHKLRHTAATLMYQHGGVDVRVLKEVLGHENLATTEIYTHLSSEQMKKAADSNPLAKVNRKKD